MNSNKKFNFTLKKNTITNIYYPWRNNSKIFSSYSIFDNYKTVDDEIFMRDERTCYLYDNKKKNYYLHNNILWLVPSFNKILQDSENFHIDCT